MQTKPNIDMLVGQLGLNEYQANILRKNYDKYDVSRLVKRGGVLYAPRRDNANRFVCAIHKLLFGDVADLIGHDKILLHAARHVKFMRGGVYCIRIGQYKYWADRNGHALSGRAAHQIIYSN